MQFPNIATLAAACLGWPQTQRKCFAWRRILLALTKPWIGFCDRFRSDRLTGWKQRRYSDDMKTLSITEGRQNLSRWVKRALQGEDVGFLLDGRVVALRPVEVDAADYVLQEYGATQQQAERAFKAVRADVRKARAAGTTKPFTGKL